MCFLQNIVEWKLVQAVLEMCAFRSQPAVLWRCKCSHSMAHSSGVRAPIWMILVLKCSKFDKLETAMQLVFWRDQTEM